MKTIFSKLEDNIFSGILIKKGYNRLTDADVETLNKIISFTGFVSRKLIIIVRQAILSAPAGVTTVPDFENMEYQELKKYVKNNNIKPASMSKADILVALKG